MQNMMPSMFPRLRQFIAELLSQNAKIRKLEEELEIERMRLVGCGVAAMCNTRKSSEQRITKDNQYWSASYDDVCNAVDREMAMREHLERECRNMDSVLLFLGLEPEDYRTDGGFLRTGKLKADLIDMINKKDA